MGQKLQVIFSRDQKFDPTLDAVRALSVFSIIAFHVTVGCTMLFNYVGLSRFLSSFPTVLSPLWHGEKGVDAFFLISGTVLGIPLFKRLDQFDWRHGLEFYKARFLRIYPLFVVVLLLYSAPRWDSAKEYILSNLLFITNIVPKQEQIIGVGWSLLVEMQYYVFVPFLFFILKRISARGWLLLGLVGSSILVNCWILKKYPFLFERPLTNLLFVHDRTQMTELYYESFLTRYGPFLMGISLAYFRVFYSHFFENHLKTQGWLIFCISLLCIFSVVGLPIYDPTSWYNSPFSPDRNFVMMAASRQFFSFGVVLLILGCWYARGPFQAVKKIFEWKIWIVFSRLSFPIYLLHFPLVGVAAVISFGTTDVKSITSVSFIQGLSIFVITCILSVLVSIPFHLYIERPFFYRKKL